MSAVGGRPTKLTPSLQHRICDRLRKGNYIETAAADAGIHKDTLYAWLKRGARERELRAAEDAAPRPKRETRAWRKRQQESADRREREQSYLDFSDAVEQAEAEGEALMVAAITRAAANGQWKAAAWRLAHGPSASRWGRKHTVTHQGPGGGPIVTADALDLSRLSDADLAKLEEMVRQMSGADADAPADA
jgi:hypothetical protein